MRLTAATVAALALAALATASPAGAQTGAQSGYGSNPSGYQPPAQYDDEDAPPPPAPYAYGRAPSKDDEDGGRSADPRYRGDRSAPADQGGDTGSELLARLHLRVDQQGAFRDYQAAFQAEQDEAPLDDPSRLQSMTALQRLDATAQQMERDRTGFERIAASTRRFYAVLDPTQRRTFDELTAPPVEQEQDQEDAPGATGRPGAGERPSQDR